MTYSFTIHETINEIVITKDGFATLADAKNEAKKILRSNKRLFCVQITYKQVDQPVAAA